jgi:hypothetical protein
MVNGLLCMPLLLFAVQAPLWVMKASWRFGIVPAHVLSSSVQTRALSIRDLLVATATIAVATAAPRFIAMPSDLSGSSQFPVEIGVAAGAATVISLLVVVSALLITLCIPHAAISMLLASLVQVVVCVGALVVAGVIFDESPEGDDIVLVAGILIGFTISLNIPLIYLRHQGYRLRRAAQSRMPD